MLKSDAEHTLRRAAEENGAEFTDAQIAALSEAMAKIAGRTIEEALSSWNGKPGSRPMYFSE